MFKLINSILPSSVKQLLIRIPRTIFKAHWENVNQSISKIELSDKHLQNLKALTSREELLKLMPKGGVVAELGVDEGTFSEKIIHLSMPEKLYLVDVWESTRYNKTKQHSVQTKFKEGIADGKDRRSRDCIFQRGVSIRCEFQRGSQRIDI